MQHSHVVEALPKLRRHAFIMFGDRTLADASVSQCLEAYKRMPASVRPETASLDLFRLFHGVVTTPLGHKVQPLPLAALARNPETGKPLRDLTRLSAAERQVYGLISVEGLSVAETAQVLGKPEEQVRHLMGRACRALALNVLAPTGTHGH